MPGAPGAGLDENDKKVVAEVGRRYDSNHHLESSAEHSAVLDDEFLQRFAIVGDPDRCAERVLELAGLGLDRFVITGATIDADRDQARVAARLMRTELLPSLRASG
jgi:5,10-methylenetetrahydromethanopterin reductase